MRGKQYQAVVCMLVGGDSTKSVGIDKIVEGRACDAWMPLPGGSEPHVL